MRCILCQVHCTLARPSLICVAAMSQGETSSLIRVKVGKRLMVSSLSSAEKSDITGITESTEFKHLFV